MSPLFNINILQDGKKIDVWAARISYVGESGWEIYLNNDSHDGLALFDSLQAVGVVPVGIETYEDLEKDLDQALILAKELVPEWIRSEN